MKPVFKHALVAGLMLGAAPAGLGQVSGPGGGPAVPAEARPLQDKPPVLQAVRFEQRLNEQVPLDVTLRDERGRTVKLGDYLGRKPVILTLVYFRCPKLCTLVVNGLTEALEAMDMDVGREFAVLTVSFDPKDTPETAAEKKTNYLARYNRPGAAEGWHFLTGPKEEVDRIAEAVGFHYVYDPVSGEYAHASGIVVLTPAGKVARYLFGISYSPRDVRLALVEASQEKIGTVIDSVMLYCFHYDASSGKYSANVMGFLRLGGGATIAALAGFFAVMGWRSWRRRGASPPTSG